MPKRTQPKNTDPSRRLTPNFTLGEFIRSDTAKRLDIDNTPSRKDLANIMLCAVGLEMIRKVCGRAVHITSGYRNDRLNAAVGGTKTSDHRLGFAADIRVDDMSAYDLARVILEWVPVFDQLILETSRGVVHISFNPRLRNDVLTQPGGAGTKFLKGLHK